MNNKSTDFFRGYVSEEHKKKFTIIAGILGGIFFIGQFVLPVLVMFIIMPVTMFSPQFMKDMNIKRAALWDDAIWFVESARGINDTVSNNMLKKIPLDEKHEPIEITALTGENIWLLKSSDRLWIISNSEVSWYMNGEISTVCVYNPLGSFGRPFLYNNMPAIIEETPDFYNLRVFIDDYWYREQRLHFRIRHLKSAYWTPIFQVIAKDDNMHVFMQYNQRIYYRSELPTNPEDTTLWQTVGYGGYNFYATIIDGQPAVFSGGDIGKHMSYTYKGMVLSTDGKWKEICHIEVNPIDDFAVFPLEGKRYIIATSSTFPANIVLRTMNRDIIEEEKQYGSSSFFPSGFMLLFFIPYFGSILTPIILAIIFTSLMKKYRVTEYMYEDRRIPFASLIKRGIAQIVDTAIVGIPFIIFYILMFSWMFDPMKIAAMAMFGMLWLFLAGIAWALCWFLVYSFLEGRYGKTPGKLIMGIQVLGIDLKPCGFGRALVRNVLAFVDGFFNYLVGVIIIALNENWQRVGDMAARTIVIDSRHNT